MHLTVAICTWNRARLLRRTLERLTELTPPDETTWELIVVDNNCTDETPDVVASFGDALPISLVHEPKQGISHARNAAVAHARGDYVLWTDDDVLVDANWLAAYAQAFREHPDAAVFGGPIRPWFEGRPPAWIERAWPILADVYAARDFGDETMALSHRVVPYGANFAVRMTEQREHPFDSRLGKVAHEQTCGEETALVRSILAAGGPGWWVPEAKVRHFVPADRQSLRFVSRWFMAQGRSGMQFRASEGQSVMALRAGAAKRFIVGAGKLALRRWISPPQIWVNDLRSACVALGYLLAPVHADPTPTPS